MTVDQIYDEYPPHLIAYSIYARASRENRNLTLEDFHRLAEQHLRECKLNRKRKRK